MVDFPGRKDDRHPQGFSLRDIVYVLFRRRLVIVAVLLPILAVASLGLFQDTGMTIAACKILVELQAPETPRWNTRMGIDYDRQLSTMIHMAMSLPVARLAADALQDSLDVITGLQDGAFADLADRRRLAEFLYQRLDVSPVGESSILNLTFGSHSPRLSLMAVGAMREAFMKHSITATKNTQALEYYDDQVRLVRDELDTLLSQRAQVVAEAGYGSIEFDLRGISQQIIDLNNIMTKDSLERAYLETKVRAMRAAHDADPGYTPSPEKANVGTTMLGAKNQVEQLRAQRVALLTKYTEDHIEVRRLDDRLREAIAVLRVEVDNYIDTYEQEVEALLAKESTMLARIQELELTIARVPELSRQISLYDTELAAKTQLLKDLQVKRGEVLINTGADERIASIIRLNDPEIETVISGARRFVYFALIMVFGLIFALTVAMVVDSRDHRLHAPERIETQLGLPVLAAVSEEGSRRTGS